jgi:hypothetical protein
MKEYTGDTFGAPQPDFDTYYPTGACKDCNEEKGPCWKGYQMVGMKMKNGKEVPNCVPINEDELYEGDFCRGCLAKYIVERVKMLEEAEYHGRKVSIGKPFRTSGGPKKFSVYVKNKKGNTIKVNFGDPNMRIKKNIPNRRKSFRARHNCATAKDRTSARYWSCKNW